MAASILAWLAVLLPLIQTVRRTPLRDALFWALLVVATLGPVAWVIDELSSGWRTGFAPSLWAIIAASIVLYSLIAALVRDAWRLAPLVAAYLGTLGVLALVWDRTTGKALDVGPAAPAWIVVHITTALLTYGLVTLAAIAAVAAVIQEQALRRRRPHALSRQLPSIAGCESLVLVLLRIGEAVLGLGLATGMALQYQETGFLIPLNHKTILTFAAFIVIGALLIAHYGTGVRGRRAAQIVLLSYLLLTLGYPGVKFVTDVLLS